MFAQASSELWVVGVEMHVDEFDALVGVVVGDRAWFAAESLVFAAASVLGVDGAYAVGVSCEYLSAE